ncbi:hypothetical protein AB8I23_004176 [Vibrio alginolyticus]
MRSFMWKEGEMTNAWSRRIARDMPKMPFTMRLLFYIAYFFSKNRHVASLSIMMLSIIAVALVFKDSYLFGGKSLLSSSPYLNYVYLSFAALVSYWILMFAINAGVQIWYAKCRNGWH